MKDKKIDHQSLITTGGGAIISTFELLYALVQRQVSSTQMLEIKSVLRDIFQKQLLT